MRLSSHAPLFVLALTVAAAVAVFAARPDGGDEPAPDEADDGAAALLADAKRRCAAKRELVEELVAGRRTLAEVAARFAALDADRPGYGPPTWFHPDAPPAERYCRLVISHVEAVLRGDYRRRAVLARLDAELAAAVAARGKSPHAETAAQAGPVE